MEITKEAMERAVNFLAETDVEYARAKTLFDGLSEERKTVKAQIFMRSGQTSATAKENDAYSSIPYKNHLKKIETAQISYLTLQAQRNTQVTIIECWRSLNAARNKGQIV